jgi:acyl-CoA synthetase (AMP-forming)/AMP-acid ligase II
MPEGRDTVDSVLRRQAALAVDKPMVIDAYDRLTFGDLERNTRRLAACLLEAGITKGTRVGLIKPNGTLWVEFAIAITRIGAVLVPLSTLMRPGELVAQLRAASVQHLIAAKAFRGHRYLAELRVELDDSGPLDGPLQHTRLPALRHTWTTDQIRDIVPSVASESFVDTLAAAVRPADPLLVLFTSGSSGPPKGVIHSHGNAFGAVRPGLVARCITADTRLYLQMPMFWVGGFGAGVLATLLAGATLITEPSSQPEATLRLLERERITLYRGWREQADALARVAAQMKVDLSSLQPGSLDAMLPPALRAQPGARASLFGMTEAFGPFCGYPADTDMPPSAWGSCGKPFAGMDVRIVDPDTGAEVPAGTVGMMQIRGPHIMRGICHRSREELFTADGFYPTGDLCHLDADGFMFYHGRSDDMFKISGATVYPVEVETALRTVSGVDGIWVTNVPGPEGNRVGAAVLCDTAVMTVEELRTAAKALLSSFKVPTVWLLLDDDTTVPRTLTGKVNAPGLRALFMGAPTTNGDTQ